MTTVDAAGLTPLDFRAAPCRLGIAREIVTIDLLGIVVEVRFDCAEAAQTYRSRYRHVLTSRTPQRVAFALTDERGASYFWMEGYAAYRWDGTPLKPHSIAFLTDAVVNSTLFSSLDDVIVLHAAGIGNGRAGAAIVGTTTAGKTTTSIACARRGLDLFSDEFCVVRPDGVHAFRRSISLRCAATELLANEPVPGSAVDRWLQTHGCCDGYDLGYDELFGELRSPRPVPLRAAFALVGKRARPSIRSISPRGMIDHVRPWAKLKQRGFEALTRLAALFGTVACYEVTIGTPDATALAIASALEAVERGAAA